MTERRRNLLIWTLFCVVVGSVFVIYASASRAAGRGEFLMPLDDVYIHFQYARQLAAVQPYVYNPGQPPTSGATSFLYPFVLAFGYVAGFQGLNLGLWAMIVGALALLASMQTVYLLCRAGDAPHWLSILTALTSALTGSVAWHYMSGMETGLMCLFTLLTPYMVVTKKLRGFVFVAAILALIRPEGSLMAVIASGVMLVRLWGEGRTTGSSLQRRYLLILLIPVAALAIQPLVNFLVTGTFVASGNQSKSILGMVPFVPEVVADRIWTNFTRMWGEFVTGFGEYGMYLPVFMGLAALFGVLVLLSRRERRLVGVMILLWMLAVFAAVSTLDTAFWHFKRYQMPILALVFPLAGWFTAEIFSLFPLSLRTRSVRFAQRTVEQQQSDPISFVVLMWLIVAFVTGVWSFLPFIRAYTLNATYVYEQPLQMARWLQANTPEDAVIAVHDTGMMRYMGGRTTLDMVGLTTSGAAEYWRNAPGSVAEFLMRYRPDYIASYGYGHGYGLALIADTSLYGQPLAEFPVKTAPGEPNVALAADFQGIYRPDYNPDTYRDSALQGSTLPYLRGFQRVDNINVADVISEHEHDYTWYSVRAPEGFPTDVYEISYLNCIDHCLLRDGGRRINGGEAFTVTVTPGQDVMLVSRVNAMHRVEYNVYANEQFVGTRFVPQERGRWIEIPTLIPAALVTSDKLTFRIKVNSDQGDYMPYYHLIYQGSYTPEQPDSLPQVTFQDGAIVLTDISLRVTLNHLLIDMTWYTEHGAKGDYTIFAHVYADDINQSQVAQADVRPGQNSVPPGNWIPGVLHDTIQVNLEALPPGTYPVAIGLYHPVTFERLTPVSQDSRFQVTADGRVLIGEVELNP